MKSKHVSDKNNVWSSLWSDLRLFTCIFEPPAPNLLTSAASPWRLSQSSRSTSSFTLDGLQNSLRPLKGRGTHVYLSSVPCVTLELYFHCVRGRTKVPKRSCCSWGESQRPLPRTFKPLLTSKRVRGNWRILFRFFRETLRATCGSLDPLRNCCRCSAAFTVFELPSKVRGRYLLQLLTGSLCYFPSRDSCCSSSNCSCM